MKVCLCEVSWLLMKDYRSLGMVGVSGGVIVCASEVDS